MAKDKTFIRRTELNGNFILMKRRMTRQAQQRAWGIGGPSVEDESGGGASGGGGGSALVPLGATYVMIGDGTSATGSAPGVRNAPFWLMNKISGRLLPCAWPLLAMSGSTITQDDGSNKAFITPIAIPMAAAQKPDVVFIMPHGANDNLLSNDPATHTRMQDWKDSVAASIAANPQALLHVVCGTGPSAKTGETTWRTAAWAAQRAYVEGLNNPKVVFVGLETIDPLVWDSLAADQSVHPGEVGAQMVADLIWTALSPRLVTATQQDVLDAIFANTYPGVTAQIDTDRALVGTGGTVTNMTAGSDAPTSKLATNLTGSTGVAAAAVATTGGRQKLSITLGGTVSAENKIMVQDKNNLVVTGATPGQSAIVGMWVRASAGFVNAGMDFSNFGIVGGGANSQAAAPNVTGPVANAVDSVWMAFPFPLFSSVYSAKRSVAFRYPVGALTGAVEVEQPFAFVPNIRHKGAPVYLGATQFNSSYIFALNYRLRVTGTIAGGFRVEPGQWNFHGLTQSDFVQRRIFKGGTSTIGSGTLAATLSGSTWTVTAAGAGIIAGDVLWAEIGVNNGVGGTVTVRSEDSLTAA